MKIIINYVGIYLQACVFIGLKYSSYYDRGYFRLIWSLENESAVGLTHLLYTMHS